MNSGQVPELASSELLLGELSLDGSLRHTSAILPMVSGARDQGFTSAFVPAVDAKEACLVEGIGVMPTNGLGDLIRHLRGDSQIVPLQYNAGTLDELAEEKTWPGPDLAHIKGQEHAKRALEIAAAGGHNLLMSGPPGSGKTLLARAMPSILPRMTPEESLDVTKIYSVGGLLPSDKPLVVERPFRSPHYSISNAGLVGGGRLPRPGEIYTESQGCAVPRRTARVGALCSGIPPPAHGRPGGHNQSRRRYRHISGQLRTDRGHECLPMWVL